MVLTKTKNFYVMASIGPIVEGYVLICSKKHYLSSGNLPERLYPEFDELKGEIEEVFVKNYGGYTFFEHGKTKACAKNGDDQHCFHAHLHAIPLRVNILPELEKELGRPEKILSHKMISTAVGNEPYLFYETEQGKFVWRAPKDLRQQFFRWLLAKELGTLEKADWKLNPNWEEAEQTKKELAGFW